VTAVDADAKCRGGRRRTLVPGYYDGGRERAGRQVSCREPAEWFMVSSKAVDTLSTRLMPLHSAADQWLSWLLAIAIVLHGGVLAP